MTEITGPQILFGLLGCLWLIGGVLQWLTLRKQERLVDQLNRRELALRSLAMAMEERLADPFAVMAPSDRHDAFLGSVRPLEAGSRKSR